MTAPLTLGGDISLTRTDKQLTHDGNQVREAACSVAVEEAPNVEKREADEVGAETANRTEEIEDINAMKSASFYLLSRYTYID